MSSTEQSTIAPTGHLTLNEAVERVAQVVSQQVTIQVPVDDATDEGDIQFQVRWNTQLIGLVRIAAPSIVLAAYDEVLPEVKPSAVSALKARLGLTSLRK